MSTNATIGYQKPNEEVVVAYCHFDGYIDGVGTELYDSFTTFENVEDLVNRGDMSYIGEPYTDRGESFEDNKPRTYQDIDYLLRYDCPDHSEYVYVFTDDGWIVSDHSAPFESLADLLND